MTKKVKKRKKKKCRISSPWACILLDAFSESVISVFMGLIITLVFFLLFFLRFQIEDSSEPLTKMKIKQEVPVVATAYASLAAQTDSTPCITANGYNLCEKNKENVIASNFLKFGTKVRFPELFGDRIFTVQDRMNSRYGYGRIDIWKINNADAKNFGKKNLLMQVVEEIEE